MANPGRDIEEDTMSEVPAKGWRLSQEQLQFLEELLTEAVLEHSDARLQAALDEQKRALKAARG